MNSTCRFPALVILLFAIVLFNSACSAGEDVAEPNIYLRQSSIKMLSDSSSMGFQTATDTHLKKASWKLLMDKYPKASAIIFSTDTIHDWSTEQFKNMSGANAGTITELRVRKLDSTQIAQVNALLPSSAYNNETGDGANQKFALTSSIIKDYKKLKQAFGKSEFNEIEIYCNSSTLKKIMDHTYGQ
jgi:hypothetical protein